MKKSIVSFAPASLLICGPERVKQLLLIGAVLPRLDVILADELRRLDRAANQQGRGDEGHEPRNEGGLRTA